jgi:hypothetical protein
MKPYRIHYGKKEYGLYPFAEISFPHLDRGSEQSQRLDAGLKPAVLAAKGCDAENEDLNFGPNIVEHNHKITSSEYIYFLINWEPICQKFFHVDIQLLQNRVM